MTSRERVEAALRHREPDRTPIFEYVLLSPLADVFLGRPYAGDPSRYGALVDELGWREAVRRIALDRLDLAVALGHDMLYVTPNPPPPTAAPKTVDTPPLPDDPVERIAQRNERVAAANPAPPDETFQVYVDLRQGMAERGLGRGIQSYEITGVTLVRGRNELEPAVVDVSCTIDGVDVVIHTVEREPLSWAN